MTEPIPGNEKEEARQCFHVTKIIHYALVSGLLMFGAVVLMIAGEGMSLSLSLRDPRIVVAAALWLVTVVLSSTIHRFYRNAGAAPAGVRAIVGKYQVFCLVRWAIIEGGALLAAAVALVTRNALPFFLFAASFALLLYRRPSEKEILALMEDAAKK